MRAHLRRSGGTDIADDLTIRRLADCSHPLNDDRDLDPLLDRIGDAHYVLLGEASHGTHDYYDWRARISRRLITEKEFAFVAVEGDWPDCYRVNRYVKGMPHSGGSAHHVLNAFDRWPTWMWANQEIVDFAEWLRDVNLGRPLERRVGFFGLDVYSLWDSLRAVLRYVEQHDGHVADRARAAMQCFEPYGEEPSSYAHATMFDPDVCEKDVVALLSGLRQQEERLRARDEEGFFDAEQNAFVIRNAERYYRAMVRSDSNSWNVRDIHMADTLDRLVRHHGRGAKAIVWEHNTHIGDARATDMAASGMVNIGQLVRERHGRDGVVLVGFGSYAGTVIAGRAWDAPMQRMPVTNAEPGTWEDLMHRYAPADKLLIFPPVDEVPPELTRQRGHRAIGVVYHPAYERFGNYVPTSLAERYDAFLYIDRTRALQPLHMPERHLGEPPETYPWAV